MIEEIMKDRDIDCPLFQRLQMWLRRAKHCSEDEALESAREFMRDYWVTPAEQKTYGEELRKAPWGNGDFS